MTASNEGKHTAKVKGLDIEHGELAERIGDLYYDSLSDFLMALSDKLHKDGLADRNRGRVNLANELQASSEQLAQAAKHIDVAWDICEPHVKQWHIDHG